MPAHFGRFRVLNDSKANDPEEIIIKKATFKLGLPVVQHTAVGYGTQFPEVPAQFYAELALDPGLSQGDKVLVDLEILVRATDTTLKIDDWILAVSPAILISSVDIKILRREASPNKYRARATVAGANYAFKEPNEDF